MLFAIALAASAFHMSPAFATTLDIEKGVLDTQSAPARKDREGTVQNVDLKCATGDRLSMIETQSSVWGTYKSITWIRMWCKSPAGIKLPQEAGIKRTPNLNNWLSNPAVGACNSLDGSFPDTNTGDYITGIRVIDDQYSKNFRIQCGTSKVDTTKKLFEISNRQLGISELLLTPVQDNDSKTFLECGDSEVASGLKLRFRVDNNEAAFTYFQLYCSRVTVR
ncbi:hypothetical protein WDW86_10325 [Bdellovibrionota bacterium FG-2]